MRRLTLLTVLSSGLIACATNAAPSTAVRPSNRQVISAAELAQVSDRTAYDAIVRLRGEFLHSRAMKLEAPGMAQPLVYLDNMQYGPIASLRDIPLAAVQEIRLVRAIDATTRYGTGHGGGIIEVFTKQGLPAR